MAELWPWLPMPRATEKLAGATQVMGSPASEMRVSLRAMREGVVYPYTLRDRRFGAMVEAYRAAPRADWLVPVWFDRSAATGIASTDLTIACDTSADYRAGGQALVWSGCDTWTIVDIDSVGEGEITLSEAVGADHASAWVAPLKTGYVVSGLDYERIRDRGDREGISGVRVEFAFRDDAPEGATPWPQYLGLDLVRKCGIVQPLSADVLPRTAFIDNGTGIVALEPQADYIAGRYSMVWRMNSAALRWERRRWLHYLRGRDRAFWLSDWQRDLELAAPIGAADTSILVEPLLPDVAGYVGRHILVDDGTRTPREITAAVVDGANHRLSIAALGRAVAAAKITFLRLVRLGVDSIDIDHRFGFVAETSLPLVEIPDEL